ncbi:ATP-binding cassette domain-containing protein [Proteus mirabilis]|uniref:ATP-binding cassette domain-containing protein n=1 Tax=Proteus mirabilis TaxID=584 RepID=UPI0016541C36|nr:ABC transporter ATP-binding protein [Proteus mirabilis]EKU2831441.1 ABC transporter ATP-binding protein [Proteus mirabilis]MBI6255249.1 ABC transporter ATP-binding protein [Proteus mirabilis]MBI6466466.1 ABC transporter ATP-binding protein [Proteus mirabilis]HEI8497015.1 ABC transporter ATP-binding protein [Proteus mirabilis]HEK1187035.1 ABC transporter ATP-binding protein [Proteus mirabilis]
MKANPFVSLLLSLKYPLSFMVVSAILEGLCGLLLLPIIIYWDHEPSQYLWMLAGLTLITLIFQYIATLKGFLAGTTVMKILVQALIRHLPRSLTPPPQAQTLCSGAAMSAMSIPAHLLSPVISVVVTPLTVIIGLLFYNVIFAFIFMISAFLLVIVMRISAKGLYKQEATLQTAENIAAKTLADFAQHQALLRKSERNTQFSQQLQQDLRAQHHQQVQLLQRSLPYHLIFSLCIQVIFITVLVIGVINIDANQLTLAQWLAVVVLIARFIEPLFQLSHIDQALRQSKQSLTLIKNALDTPILHSPIKSDVPKNYQIYCEQLNVNNSTGKAILSDISVCCPDKKMTAVVGSSGAGKTTLLHVLARLIDADKGQILYGDKKVNDLSESVLAQTRQIVFQHNQLIKGTLRWSLLQDEQSTVSDKDILQLLNALGLSLTQADLDDDVGELGDRYSGGQKQRLCLARSLLADPKILFLDEPTASLDTISREKVTLYLENLTSTRVVITHDPDVAKRADHVIVLEDGKVIAEGSPNELLLSSTWFSRFCGSY